VVATSEPLFGRGVLYQIYARKLQVDQQIWYEQLDLIGFQQETQEEGNLRCGLIQNSVCGLRRQ
jgi:hypothetical protein